LLNRLDLLVEVIHQLQARVDGRAPRLRDLQTIKQLTAGDAEQVGDRARVLERDHRGVNAVLEHRAVLDQVQAEARKLALAAHRRVR
jgi:hypothetical protein